MESVNSRSPFSAQIGLWLPDPVRFQVSDEVNTPSTASPEGPAVLVEGSGAGEGR